MICTVLHIGAKLIKSSISISHESLYKHFSLEHLKLRQFEILGLYDDFVWVLRIEPVGKLTTIDALLVYI